MIAKPFAPENGVKPFVIMVALEARGITGIGSRDGWHVSAMVDRLEAGRASAARLPGRGADRQVVLVDVSRGGRSPAGRLKIVSGISRMAWSISSAAWRTLPLAG